MLRIEPYIPGLYRFALALCRNATVAEDLTQETLVRALAAANPPKQDRAVKSWLFTVLANYWRDEGRSARNRLRQTASDGAWTAESVIDSGDGPDQRLIQNETRIAILSRMQNLPERQRQVLYLRAVEEFSIDEIATTLSLNRDAVKSSLSVARKTMRSWASQQDADGRTLGPICKDELKTE